MLTECTCDDCGHQFDADIPEDTDDLDITCPNCGSDELGWSEFFGDDDEEMP